MKSEQRRICIRDQLIKAIQGRTVPAAVADKFLERIHPSGNWHDSVPPGWGAEGGTPQLRVPSGPRGLLLRSTSALPGRSALGASVLPAQLDCLLFPELACCLPLQVLVPGICFRLECPFSHLFKSFLFKVPALIPAPPGSLWGASVSACLPAPHPTSPSPPSRAVTARVCPGSSPRPGCACRKGGGCRHWTLCGFFLPRLSLGVGAPCLEGLHAFPACDKSCPCS